MTPNHKPEESPEITPQVVHLRDLLKWVKQGRVRVPHFQRDFTWDRGRMLNLFDSIRRQYPIGTLLFWDTKLEIPRFGYLGPLRLPDPTAGNLIILDGQQRLTTLAGVLLYFELDRNENDDRDANRWLVCYDAASDTFCHSDHSDNGSIPPPVSIVPVSDLMGTKGLYAAAQRIMATTDKDREAWVERIESVSAALGAYRLPLVIFSTDSLQLAVESFARLNKAGQSMGPDEMFSALTYKVTDGAESFRLATHIDSILKDLVGAGFGKVERVLVLRVVLLAAELDPFRTDWGALAEDTKNTAAAKLPDAIKQARQGLLGAIGFLRGEGIATRRLLPYSMQLVGLATFFGRRIGDATPEQLLLLRKWLWVTAFTENFGESNFSRQVRQLKSLRDEVPLQECPESVDGIELTTPAHPFPERHDHRSARVRALLCVMLRNKTYGPEGEEFTPDQMAQDLRESGPEALARVCSSLKEKELSSPANRVFDANKKVRGQAKNWLLSLPETDRKKILDAHYISDSAYGALQTGDSKKFVQLRMKSLMDLENEFMKEKGVVPPKSEQPAPSAIDVEDDAPLSEIDDPSSEDAS